MAGEESGRLKGPLVVKNCLIKVVVLPDTGDLQVQRGHSYLPEACVEEHPLGGAIAQEGAGFDPVQPEVIAGHPDDRSHSRRGKPSARVISIHPVRQSSALKWAAHNSSESESSDDSRPIEQTAGIPVARIARRDPLSDVFGLPGLGEEDILSAGLPPSQMVTIARVGGSQFPGIAETQKTHIDALYQVHLLKHPSILGVASAERLSMQ